MAGHRPALPGSARPFTDLLVSPWMAHFMLNDLIDKYPPLQDVSYKVTQANRVTFLWGGMGGGGVNFTRRSYVLCSHCVTRR